MRRRGVVKVLSGRRARRASRIRPAGSAARSVPLGGDRPLKGAGTRINEDDIASRNLTDRRFVELGRAPTATEIAAVAGLDEAEFTTGWERLTPPTPHPNLPGTTSG